MRRCSSSSVFVALLVWQYSVLGCDAIACYAFIRAGPKVQVLFPKLRGARGEAQTGNPPLDLILSPTSLSNTRISLYHMLRDWSFAHSLAHSKWKTIMPLKSFESGLSKCTMSDQL